MYKIEFHKIREIDFREERCHKNSSDRHYKDEESTTTVKTPHCYQFSSFQSGLFRGE